MDCRSFRSKHVAFVDDFLPGEDVVAMERHLAECERCATHDAKVRRSLLVFKNLPAVEPSPDFYARLSARIESERSAPPRTMFAARGPGSLTVTLHAAPAEAVGYRLSAAVVSRRPVRHIAIDALNSID